jgi:hypothetical protein
MIEDTLHLRLNFVSTPSRFSDLRGMDVFCFVPPIASVSEAYGEQDAIL